MQLIKAERDELLKPLATVVGIVERRNTMPILGNILLQKTGNRLAFVASDLEVQITSEIDTPNGEETTSTTVAARKFLDILRALPEGETVTILLDNNKLLIQTNNSRFELQTLPAADFPVVKQPDTWDVTLRLPQAKLRYLFGLVHFAMAQQDIRYYLNGLLMVFEEGHVRAVATDGHRLAHAGVAVADLDKKNEIIVPRKTILELQRLLDDTEDPVTIQVAAGQIRFQFNSVELISKLVEGKFPDFTRVIPTNYTRHFSVSRDVLQGSLQRAAILTTEKLKGVRLQMDDHLLKVSSSNAEQEEAYEEIQIDYQHEPLDVGFNVSYLLDVLANVRSDMVIWSVQPDINASALITIPDDNEFKYVVMPMRI